MSRSGTSHTSPTQIAARHNRRSVFAHRLERARFYWNAVIAVNLSGSFHMTKAVLEHMIERGSRRVVNISSAASARRHQLGGITANVVTPGFIETEVVAAIPKEAMQKVIERIPQRRLGRPEEVARVVRFLLADESSSIAGAVFAVNGGLDM